MSKKAHIPVIERLLSGWTHPQGPDMAFNDALAEWHSDKVFTGSIYEYMGLTWEEYRRWAGDAKAAAVILQERRSLRAQ
jgi:hypothetical protein